MLPIVDDVTPLGSGDYVVADGECVSSVAEKTGHFWQTLWTLPANQAVKEGRKDPNVLLAGDRLTIPEIQPKTLPAATGATHVYRRRGVPVFLRVRFLDGDGAPRKGDYVLHVAGSTIHGTLDAEGWLVQPVPPATTTAVVELANGMSTTLQLGSLDPVQTLAGVRARLLNLGYSGANSGESGLRTALAQFQEDHGLPRSGVADDATRQALVTGFGA